MVQWNILKAIITRHILLFHGNGTIEEGIFKNGIYKKNLL